MSTAKHRVARGAAKLDELLGSRSAWAEAIDLDTLVMESTFDCVLAQKFGHYDDGLEALGINRGDAAGYGFVCSTDFGCECPELANEWRALIKEG